MTFLARSLAVLLPAVLFLAAAPSLHAADGAALEKRVIRYSMPNGLKVLLLPRTVSPTLSFYIRHKAGAVDETDRESGTAHFLEHMLFKGTRTLGAINSAAEKPLLAEIARTGKAYDRAATPKRKAALKARLDALEKRHKALYVSSEIDRIYQESGAVNLNASTGQDLITYHVSLPANKAELWARIESDRMANTVFREFYKERDVILEERRQRIETNPDGKLAEQFYAAAFPGHPYRRPVIGYAGTIARLSPRDLHRFAAWSHAPNNTVIAVVGDFDPDAMRGLLARYFGPLKRHGGPRPSVNCTGSFLEEKRIAVSFDASPQILLGFRKPAPPARDDYVLDVIEAILSRGRLSRFHRFLVEGKGVAESADAANGMPGARCDSLFVISAAPRSPHTVAALERELDAILEDLKTSPPRAEEMQRIQNSLRADFIRRQGSNNGLASLLSYYEALLGNYRYVTRYLDVMDTITAAEVQQTAARIFTRSNRVSAMLQRPGDKP